MFLRRTMAVVVLLVVGAICVAGDEADQGPRTPAAKGALAKLEQAKEKARLEYERAVAKAEDEAARELEKIRADVMKKGGEDALAEAVRIQKAIESLNADADDATKIEVRAGAGWQKSIEVRRGQRISVRTSGKWCADPARREAFTFGAEGERDGKWFGLMGKVGNSEFRIGARDTVISPETGTLMLQVGGGDVTRDDDGALQVVLNAR